MTPEFDVEAAKRFFDGLVGAQVTRADGTLVPVVAGKYCDCDTPSCPRNITMTLDACISLDNPPVQLLLQADTADVAGFRSHDVTEGMRAWVAGVGAKMLKQRGDTDVLEPLTMTFTYGTADDPQPEEVKITADAELIAYAHSQLFERQPVGVLVVIELGQGMIAVF